MKLLVWNIEKFTDAKLEDFGFLPKQKLSRRKKVLLDGQYRLNYLEKAITTNIPDVIAILEVLAGRDTDLGEPLEKSDAYGIVNLLKKVKAWTKNNDWRLVPPLKCNPKNSEDDENVAHEVVGVLYNTKTVSFEGPDTNLNYPAFWKTQSLTSGTTKSGKIRFYANVKEIEFPNNYHRRPFMVDFREVGGKKRLIRCLFSHTSPGFHVGGTSAIASIPEMTPAAGVNAPDICVAAGDFNVNDWNTKEAGTSYNPILGKNYTKQFSTANKSTHFYRKTKATPDGRANPYGYMQHKVIDNFLVRPTSGGAPVCTKFIVNAVDGSPLPYTTAMANSLATITPLKKKVSTFRQWYNFWCIVATSDHAPIFLEIP